MESGKRKEAAPAVAAASTNEVQAAAQAPAAVPAAPVAEPVPAKPVDPAVPEKTVVLENDQLRLELSSWGAVVKKVTLKEYARDRGAISDSNPALEFDFSSSPLGALGGVDGVAANAAYRVGETGSNSVVFACGHVLRKVTLDKDYRIVYEEKFAGADAGENTLSLGVVAMGAGKNDMLSVDSWSLGGDGGKVIHHCEGDSPLKAYLVGGMGGCSGSSSAAGLPRTVAVPYAGAQKWVALKNRFFAAALVSSSEANLGFDAEIARDMKSSDYRPESISAKARFASLPGERTSVFYVGPKKQSVLWDLGMKDVMEFGMWRWICYSVVWLLDFCHDYVPSYGIAIILLTLLVRILFWPLTHKSTVGMKKMQELQPKLKAIQAQFKDNPQRLQQETWALYRDAKVNPMSSCLPMLVQIPVFIALFNVLRSAVELRYAPFLWIADLSEPEGLFASWFPFGGLNILPIFMAATMALQSALTPSTGDKNQQKMMIVFMPIMMLFMFYSFPSALSLYWTVSQILSIVQMWLIRRSTAKKTEVLVPEVIDPPQTRQMRRHG
jgi:YidC/Oxa1 family membrane protein insertase